MLCLFKRFCIDCSSWVDYLSFCWLVKAEEALVEMFVPGLFLILESLWNFLNAEKMFGEFASGFV